MTSFFLLLCWKNIWRNKHRTLITVSAIGVGVTALVGIHNYYDSFHEQVIHNVIRYHSGHLLITAPGYLENNVPGKYLKDTRAVEKHLTRDPSIKAFSYRILVQGLLSSPQGSANILLTGIDPKRESEVTRFSTNIIHGKYLDSKARRSIVVGSGLAKLLKLKVGDKSVALTQGVDGSIGNELFHVAGIFETQSDLDKSLAFILLDDARTLLSIPGKRAAHQIAIILNSESDLSMVAARLRKLSSAKDVQVHTWMQIQRPLMAIFELNKSANRLLMIVVLIVAALGIGNSILMSVLERTREFGVMLAIGTSMHEVVKMVIVETMLLSTVGVALGNVFGIALTLYFNQVGFDLKWFTDHQIVVQGAIIQTVSYPTIQWSNSLLVSILILFLSALVSFIPVRHVASLDAVTALRGP